MAIPLHPDQVFSSQTPVQSYQLTLFPVVAIRLPTRPDIIHVNRGTRQTISELDNTARTPTGLQAFEPLHTCIEARKLFPYVHKSTMT
jgi:hypothetical protein